MSVVPDPRPLDTTLGYHGAVCDFKRRLIEATLHEARGNRTHAARALGLQRTYLLRLIRDLGVAAPPPAARGRAVEQRAGQEGPPVSPPLHAGRDHRVDSPAASAAYPPRRPPARASGDNGRRPSSRVGGSSRP
jgi:regulatory Fis family protein